MVRRDTSCIIQLLKRTKDKLLDYPTKSYTLVNLYTMELNDLV